MGDDLISRKELMEEIESLYMSITGLRAGKGVLLKFMEEYKKSVLKCIDEQPIAYDVDAVCCKLHESMLNEASIEGIGLTRKHIEIVRNGGKREWKN